MEGGTPKKTLIAAAAGFVAAAAAPASALMLSDGFLSVNVDGFGQFNQISIDGASIDTSTFGQETYINGINSDSAGTPAGGGSSATYFAGFGGFQAEVLSEIIGTLPGSPTTAVFRQTFIVTSFVEGPTPLDIVSFMDPDVGDTVSNTTYWDAGAGAVVATDGSALFAARALSGPGSTSFDVDILGSVGTSAPLPGGAGPVGVADIAMAVGFDGISLENGESATFTFEYLFDTTRSTVPGSTVPVPAALPLLGLGIVSLAALRRRRRA